MNGLSGRRGQARRNDELILESARAVFIADPDAPIAAVAKHAGVGVSALYRRYAGKEELLRKLCGDGLRLYVQIARRAVEEGTEDDPWDTFARFMRRIVEADTHTLTINLAGRFQPTEDLAAEGATAEELNALIVKRAQKAGVLRRDIGPHDLSHIFEQIANVHGPTPNGPGNCAPATSRCSLMGYVVRQARSCPAHRRRGKSRPHAGSRTGMSKRRERSASRLS